MLSSLVNRFSSPSRGRSRTTTKCKIASTAKTNSQKARSTSTSIKATNATQTTQSSSTSSSHTARQTFAKTKNSHPSTVKQNAKLNMNTKLRMTSNSSSSSSSLTSSALPSPNTDLTNSEKALLTFKMEKCSLHEEIITSENIAAESIYQTEQLYTCKQKEINIKEMTNRLQISERGRFADENEYRMNNAKRGTAVIINNKIFDSRLEMPTRDGTDKDAASLEFCLRKLGFEIRLFHNCSAFLMRDLLLRYAKADHSDSDCFLCVIMSHGENGVIYGIDQEIEIERLIDPFKANRTLSGKPKLFFIQACRGTRLMEGIDSNPFEVNYVSKIPMEADFLIGYSTIAGYYSWRNSLNGSWFIQSLCSILNEYGDSLEIMQLLTAVNRRVAYYYESNTTDSFMHGKKQVPCIVSMLTKELYFRPKSNFHTFSTKIAVNYS